jgi:cyclic pyranopterin phosphate synthase
VERISLTTNGLLLEEKVDALAAAGVGGLNLSLDTLDREKFRRITGADVLERVRRGIERAMAAPFRAIKINVVAMRGVNDDEILDFLELGRDRPVHLRFIEYMPRGDFSEEARKRIPCEEILSRIGDVHPYQKDPGPQGSGPATYYRVPGWAGTFGVISPVTNPFCEMCNRIRLTCRGEIKSCLLIEEFLDLKPILRNGAGTDALLDAIGRAIREKPERHDFRRHFPMNSIGG